MKKKADGQKRNWLPTKQQREDNLPESTQTHIFPLWVGALDEKSKPFRDLRNEAFRAEVETRSGRDEERAQRKLEQRSRGRSHQSINRLKTLKRQMYGRAGGPKRSHSNTRASLTAFFRSCSDPRYLSVVRIDSCPSRN
jgi:hypothetical protein